MAGAWDARVDEINRKKREQEAEIRRRSEEEMRQGMVNTRVPEATYRQFYQDRSAGIPTPNPYAGDWSKIGKATGKFAWEAGVVEPVKSFARTLSGDNARRYLLPGGDSGWAAKFGAVGEDALNIVSLVPLVGAGVNALKAGTRGLSARSATKNLASNIADSRAATMAKTSALDEEMLERVVSTSHQINMKKEALDEALSSLPDVAEGSIRVFHGGRTGLPHPLKSVMELADRPADVVRRNPGGSMYVGPGLYATDNPYLASTYASPNFYSEISQSVNSYPSYFYGSYAPEGVLGRGRRDALAASSGDDKYKRFDTISDALGEVDDDALNAMLASRALQDAIDWNQPISKIKEMANYWTGGTLFGSRFKTFNSAVVRGFEGDEWWASHYPELFSQEKLRRAVQSALDSADGNASLKSVIDAMTPEEAEFFVRNLDLPIKATVTEPTEIVAKNSIFAVPGTKSLTNQVIADPDNPVFLGGIPDSIPPRRDWFGIRDDLSDGDLATRQVELSRLLSSLVGKQDDALRQQYADEASALWKEGTLRQMSRDPIYLKTRVPDPGVNSSALSYADLPVSNEYGVLTIAGQPALDLANPDPSAVRRLAKTIADDWRANASPIPNVAMPKETTAAEWVQRLDSLASDFEKEIIDILLDLDVAEPDRIKKFKNLIKHLAMSAHGDKAFSNYNTEQRIARAWGDVMSRDASVFPHTGGANTGGQLHGAYNFNNPETLPPFSSFVPPDLNLRLAMQRAEAVEEGYRNYQNIKNVPIELRQQAIRQALQARRQAAFGAGMSMYPRPGYTERR